MNYQEFLARNHFEHEELVAFSYGMLVKDQPEGFDGRLPAPPFLMLDRILSITSDGKQGRIIAEQDVRFDAWYFQCHLPGDPVHPGCLCVDAVWQLLGFYCIWRGALGAGRALGCGEIFFNGQVRPFNKCVRYEITVKRFSLLKLSRAAVVIGDAKIFVDNEKIIDVADARSGVFLGIAYPDYPLRSLNAVGGRMKEEA
ncbi:MAG TPA: bifunctional 3-hydroxydecanoyl-ACP dehydratase/trans-2-decenoyl-ACP isomerase [Syntrophales bacterium]|nr:bifunctional 3-hydroxydecanoyl-ACP dehydratase/trans-2-decenoyl-ACP isomerase [Syntrophales bacterium]